MQIRNFLPPFLNGMFDPMTGARLKVYCLKCQQINDSMHKFCSSCGTKLKDSDNQPDRIIGPTHSW